MFWTVEEKARYLAKAVREAIKEGRGIEAAIEEALRKITEDEKGSGILGL